MAVRIEKDGSVWTVIHDRPEARKRNGPSKCGCADSRLS
jgi:hypothetical protein